MAATELLGKPLNMNEQLYLQPQTLVNTPTNVRQTEGAQDGICHRVQQNIAYSTDHTTVKPLQ